MKLPKSLLFAPMALVLTLLAGCAGSGFEQRRQKKIRKLEATANKFYQKLQKKYANPLKAFSVIKSTPQPTTTEQREKRHALEKEFIATLSPYYKDVRFNAGNFYLRGDVNLMTIMPQKIIHNFLAAEIVTFQQLAQKLQPYESQIATYKSMISFITSLNEMATFIKDSPEYLNQNELWKNEYAVYVKKCNQHIDNVKKCNQHIDNYNTCVLGWNLGVVAYTVGCLL